MIFEKPFEYSFKWDIAEIFCFIHLEVREIKKEFVKIMWALEVHLKRIKSFDMLS